MAHGVPGKSFKTVNRADLDKVRRVGMEPGRFARILEETAGVWRREGSNRGAPAWGTAEGCDRSGQDLEETELVLIRVRPIKPPRARAAEPV